MLSIVSQGPRQDVLAKWWQVILVSFSSNSLSTDTGLAPGDKPRGSSIGFGGGPPFWKLYSPVMPCTYWAPSLSLKINGRVSSSWTCILHAVSPVGVGTTLLGQGSLGNTFLIFAMFSENKQKQRREKFNPLLTIGLMSRLFTCLQLRLIKNAFYLPH